MRANQGIPSVRFLPSRVLPQSRACAASGPPARSVVEGGEVLNVRAQGACEGLNYWREACGRAGAGQSGAGDARAEELVRPTRQHTTHTAQLAHWPACCTARPLTCREILPEMQAAAEEQTLARKEIGGLSFARGGMSFARGARRKPSLGGVAPAARGHAMMTRRESAFSRGSLEVKLPGERHGRQRFLVLDCSNVRSTSSREPSALTHRPHPQPLC